MTTSDYQKTFAQLENKHSKMKKFLKHNKPKERKFGKGMKRCRFWGCVRGHIGKYGINACRRCFREQAKSMGFKKYT